VNGQYADNSIKNTEYSENDANIQSTLISITRIFDNHPNSKTTSERKQRNLDNGGIERLLFASSVEIAAYAFHGNFTSIHHHPNPL
jgi:hypothetical protein